MRTLEGNNEPPMTTYYFRMEGPGRERTPVDAPNIETARAAAIRYMGSHLLEHPEFAQEGHWRMLVEDEAGKVYFHLIVATVAAKEPPDTSR